MRKKQKKVVIFGMDTPRMKQAAVQYRAHGNAVVCVDITRFKDSSSEYISCDAVVLLDRRDMIKDAYPRLAADRGEPAPEIIELYEGAPKVVVEPAPVTPPEPEPAPTPEPAPADPEAMDPEDIDVLRAEATSLGINVDRRWSVQTLREKLADARG